MLTSVWIEVDLSWISSEWVLWAPILGFPNRLSDQKWVGWLAQRRFLTIQFESDQVCNGHGQEANYKRASETAASVTCVVAEVAAYETGTIGQAGRRSKHLRLPLFLVNPRPPRL